MSWAVVVCSGSGSPVALRKLLPVMPRRFAVAVMRPAKLVSSPPTRSASTTAASLAERVMVARMAFSTLIFSPLERPSSEGGMAAA